MIRPVSAKAEAGRFICEDRLQKQNPAQSKRAVSGCFFGLIYQMISSRALIAQA